MSFLERLLRRIVKELASGNYPWALVGGLAVSARGRPRFTQDLDLAIAVRDDAQAEDLIHSLGRGGYLVQSLVEQEAAGRLATARLSAPGTSGEGFLVDLLFASSGIEPEIVAEADPLEVFPGIEVPVARLGHLVALKVLAREDATRPQDAGDLRMLLREASDEEMKRAEEGIRLITERGFARGRDLKAGLQEAIAFFGPRLGDNR